MTVTYSNDYDESILREACVKIIANKITNGTINKAALSNPTYGKEASLKIAQ